MRSCHHRSYCNLAYRLLKIYFGIGKQYWLKAHIQRPSKYSKTRSEYFNDFMIKEEWHFIIFSQKHLRTCNLKMHHVDKRGSYKLDSLYRYRWRHPSKPQEQAERKQDSFIQNQ